MKERFHQTNSHKNKIEDLPSFNIPLLLPSLTIFWQCLLENKKKEKEKKRNEWVNKPQQITAYCEIFPW